jgi:hypothetical protein
MEGTNGVIAFGADRKQFVAAFFSIHSARSPFRRNGPAAEEGLKLLGRLPQALQPLADMALPWLMSDVNGAEMPLVSSAFWSGLPNERSTSCEPWEEVVDNGAFLIDNELLDEQAALAAWSKDMRLGEAEMALVAEVHRRRLATAAGEIVLSHLVVRLNQTHPAPALNMPTISAVNIALASHHQGSHDNERNCCGGSGAAPIGT